MADLFQGIVYYLPYLKFAEGAAVPDPLDEGNRAVRLMHELLEVIDNMYSGNLDLPEDTPKLDKVKELELILRGDPAAAVKALQEGRLCAILEQML